MSRKPKDKHASEIENDVQIISKTQKKQIVHDLQELAKTITEMPKKKVAKLNLPSVFLDAIEESKRITSHIARKRHFQYMGKVLLKLDHGALQDQIDQIENLDGHYQVRDAVITLWIEQMTTHEKQLFDHLYQFHDHEILSNLKQTWRNHKKKPDHALNRKKLFQALRLLDQTQELPNPLTII